MASAVAAASGLRQQLAWTSPNPLVLSSSSLSLRRYFFLPATSSYPALTSYFPSPHRPLPRPPSLSAARSRRLLSTPASASSPPITRVPPPPPPPPPPPRRVSVEEEDGEEEEDDEDEREGAFDVASHDDDELADEEREEPEEDVEDEEAEEDPEFRGQVDHLEFVSPAPQGQQLPSYPSPKLSVKEKKELAAYAHSLGKKLKCQQVGKSGITPSVAAAFIETLEANELLKLKVHGSCPGELPELIKQLEESTGSVAVGRIGRSVILYRPSLSKMKKKEVQAVKKTWRPKAKEPAGGLELQKKRPVQRLYSRPSDTNATRI